MMYNLTFRVQRYEKKKKRPSFFKIKCDIKRLHPQRYHTCQYIGDEGGGYQQQGDEHPFKGRDTSQQHTGIEHWYHHH